MYCFFFNDTATTEIYTLSLHDALPIFDQVDGDAEVDVGRLDDDRLAVHLGVRVVHHRLLAQRLDQRVPDQVGEADLRSEEHTSELQSRQYLVCRLLLEKKKTKQTA